MVEGHIDGCRDELVDLDVIVQAGGVLVGITSDVESLLVGIAEHRLGLDIFVTVADAETVLVLRSRLRDHEGIPVTQRIIIRIEGVVGHVVVDELFLILEVLPAFRIACIVPLSLVLEFHETGRAYLDRVGRPGKDTVAAVVVDVELSRLGALGRYQDDTTGSTCSVDGSGSSIFQYGDVVDRIHIHVIEASHRNSVHDDERVGVTDGGDTADADCRRSTRKTARTCYLHARHGSLERLGKAGGLDGGDLVSVNVGDGTCQVFLLDGTVTDDEDFVQKLCVLFENHVDAAAVTDRNDLGLVSYE